MRRAAKIDRNHGEIVEALRNFGMLVRSTAELGKGFPDAIVAFRDTLVLLEFKDGTLPPSARELTREEAIFIAAWPKTYVVTSAKEAIDVVIEAARPK